MGSLVILCEHKWRGLEHCTRPVSKARLGLGQLDIYHIRPKSSPGEGLFTHARPGLGPVSTQPGHGHLCWSALYLRPEMGLAHCYFLWELSIALAQDGANLMAPAGFGPHKIFQTQPGLSPGFAKGFVPGPSLWPEPGSSFWAISGPYSALHRLLYLKYSKTTNKLPDAYWAHATLKAVLTSSLVSLQNFCLGATCAWHILN